MSVLLVSGDRDDALVGRVLPGQLDVDVKVLAELRDDGALAADDLGMVLWLDLDLELEALGLSVSPLQLEVLDPLHERVPGFLGVVRGSGDDDCVGLELRLRHLDVHVVVVHQLANAGALLADDEAVELVRNLNLNRTNKSVTKVGHS